VDGTPVETALLLLLAFVWTYTGHAVPPWLRPRLVRAALTLKCCSDLVKRAKLGKPILANGQHLALIGIALVWAISTDDVLAATARGLTGACRGMTTKMGLQRPCWQTRC
jgi:hypothetical protein